MPKFEISINTVDSIEIPHRENIEFQWFIQLMMNRLLQGYVRYGPANRKQKYMSRMKKEMKSYIKDGNFEQLLNIANYCFLEFYAPENPRHHFDNNAKSVTRKD